MAYLTRYSNLTVSNEANLGTASGVKIGGGQDGYQLSTDGLGNLSWATKIVPAGNDTWIQFNNAGQFGASQYFTLNKTTNTLTANALHTTKNANIDGNLIVGITAGTDTIIKNSLNVDGGSYFNNDAEFLCNNGEAALKVIPNNTSEDSLVELFSPLRITQSSNYANTFSVKYETATTNKISFAYSSTGETSNVFANVMSIDQNGLLLTNAVTCANLNAAAGNATIAGNWVLAAGATLSATYADLGERYSSDEQYPPGTVVMIGGEREVTIADYKGRTKIAGVVSTNPAYILNSNAPDSVIIALTGRVPCRVTGPVSKGDYMTISKTPGVACATAKWVGGTIIGRALSDYSGEGEGVIEVKVDRG